MLAKATISRAATILVDAGAVHWRTLDLVRWYNDGQRAIATARPDATAKTITCVLVQGSAQTIPDTAQSLIDVEGNSAGRKRQVSKVDKDDLDAIDAYWQAKPPASEAIHFAHDMRMPRIYWVYPPVKAGVQLDLICSLYPTDITENIDPAATADAVTGNFSLADQFAEPLLDYVLYRAFDTDAEHGANRELSEKHRAACEAALGVQLKASALVEPK